MDTTVIRNAVNAFRGQKSKCSPKDLLEAAQRFSPEKSDQDKFMQFYWRIEKSNRAQADMIGRIHREDD